MAAAASDSTQGYTREDFATHVRTEFSTYRWLLAPPLTTTGFRIVDSHAQGRIYATYPCVRG